VFGVDVVLWKKSHRSDVSEMSGIEAEQPARVGFVEVYLGEETRGSGSGMNINDCE
jgi:hypothetical protein